MNYYLDIETTGFDYDNDSITTIQYQKLDKEGKPIEDLVILKSWESSEKEIVERFFKIFMTLDSFDFTAIGTNLVFDFSFLYSKFRKYNLPLKSDFMGFIYRDKPHIDLKFPLIIANNLDFRGSGLDKMTNKKIDGKILPQWYKNKEYEKIEAYIKDEAKSFLEVLQIIKEDLIKSKEKWKKIN